MVPAGPVRTALVTTSVGRTLSTTEFSAGDTGTGALMTTGVKMLNIDVGEYPPVLAPSCACARQKYVCPVASGSGSCRLVLPSPGVTPGRENVIVLKLESVAISNT